ncbi:HU family DNA-binding protein [Candidatus Megaera polyxenophila]|jgi:DNA-binding protein HU-beta|uniref:HU family DNA-binding protein n=1 Tax=Candidatus Megaera polyxenophila TaxID=988779 RepID=UPI00249EA9CA|nr:HU family DNA-binding protein [Candidatus Megaera polyxenophila]
MNKGDFIKFISENNNCTQGMAEKVINMFTSSVIDAISKGNEISLIGFGSFSVQKVEAREGRNPRTGNALKIGAYNQPKFKVGQKLKDAVNKK